MGPALQGVTEGLSEALATMKLGSIRVVQARAVRVLYASLEPRHRVSVRTRTAKGSQQVSLRLNLVSVCIVIS